MKKVAVDIYYTLLAAPFLFANIPGPVSGAHSEGNLYSGTLLGYKLDSALYLLHYIGLLYYDDRYNSVIWK